MYDFHNVITSQCDHNLRLLLWDRSEPDYYGNCSVQTTLKYIYVIFLTALVNSRSRTCHIKTALNQTA